APLDVLLQLGLVGLVAVGAMAGLALVRTWRLASDAKPVVAVWPALVLAALGAASLAESLVLVDWGWLLLVIGAGIGSRRGGLGRAATGAGG
ncbi:MAG: lipid A core--O-antigen ligase, partial [Archangium gephyra]